MNPTPQPSPLSIGLPLLLPKPGPEASENTNNAVAMQRQPTPAFLTSEDIIPRMCDLAANMKPRRADMSFFKVIAVDGYDRVAVHSMMKSLGEQIAKDLQYGVRLISEAFIDLPTNQTTELANLGRIIRSWMAMWAEISRLQSASSGPELHPGPVEPEPKHPGNSSSERPRIYVLPLSPFMATLHAVRHAVRSRDQWRDCSGYWKNGFRPDVIIQIQNIMSPGYHNDVLRFQVPGMNTLIVTKQGNSGLNATPQQMRRVMFEVEEWIRW